MTTPHHPPVVYIEWSDAANMGAGWRDRDDVLSDAERFYEPVCAAGFLLQDGPEYLVLAAAYNPHNDDVAHAYLIPRSEVKRKIELFPANEMEKDS